jgi:FKBP-type peptidyl-prolyl cis-trans isomerase (trigger factor)
METEQEKNTTSPEVAPTPIVTEPSSEAPVTESVTSEPQTSFIQKNKALIIAGAIALLVLIGAGGYYFYTQKMDKGTVVAMVGNAKIYEQDYLESATLVEQNAKAQGANLADEAIKKEVKNQALDILINNTLLLTAAEEAGITFSDEDVQKKYDELATQLGGPEVLAEEMAKVGLTEEKLRSNIRERVLADKYIESVSDIESITVSEEEISDFIKTISAGGQELPPIDEIRPQIKSQLLGQKQQQIITDLLAKLRSETIVDIKI